MLGLDYKKDPVSRHYEEDADKNQVECNFWGDGSYRGGGWAV